MEIGGEDLWFENGTREQWEAAKQYFFQLWPDHVEEDITEASLCEEEWMIYENQEVLDKIEAEGMIEEVENRCVYFLRSGFPGFTIVVGCKFDETDLLKVIEDSGMV